jgi:hypothetical protein
MDLAALVHEQNVAVPAEPGVAGPFVAREHDEFAVGVEFAAQPVQFVPERRGDLKIVALMAHRIEKRAVARKFDQLAR